VAEITFHGRSHRQRTSITPIARRCLVGTALVALVVPLVGNSPAGADSPALRTVASFDRSTGQTPENLAIEPDGSVFVSLSFAGEIDDVTPTGGQSTVTIPTAGGLTVGIVADLDHGGDLDVAVKSADASDAGIWRVPLAAFRDPSVHPYRIAALPTSSFPNGMAFDGQRNLYIADSTLGAIWRLSPGSSTPTVWSLSPLLAPTGASFEGFTLPGANALKVRQGVVYTSNTSTSEILTVPILPGGPAGAVSVLYQIDEPDDFAIAPDGSMFVAENVPNQFVRISPNGRVTTMFTAADGMANPSAALFSPVQGQSHELYITNSSYFRDAPSLQETRTDGYGT
jgi:streptogramin lyase